MKVVLISGSIREGSYNTKLINYINEYLNEKVRISSMIFDDLDSLPFFTPDRDIHTLDEDNSPKKVVEFRSVISSADIILISTPEYAYEIPGVLKNALDWLVSSGEFIDKKVVVMSSSTSAIGGESAYGVLVKLLKILSANVYDDKVLNVGSINKHISIDGIFSQELERKLIELIEDILK